MLTDTVKRNPLSCHSAPWAHAVARPNVRRQYQSTGFELGYECVGTEDAAPWMRQRISASTPTNAFECRSISGWYTKKTARLQSPFQFSGEIDSLG